MPSIHCPVVVLLLITLEKLKKFELAVVLYTLLSSAILFQDHTRWSLVEPHWLKYKAFGKSNSFKSYLWSECFQKEIPYFNSVWLLTCIIQNTTVMYASDQSVVANLDLITLIFGQEYKSWSFWSCNFLQHPVTSSLLGPNILLSILLSVWVYVLPLGWETKFTSIKNNVQISL
jgi:hypothetical protein